MVYSQVHLIQTLCVWMLTYSIWRWKTHRHLLPLYKTGSGANLTFIWKQKETRTLEDTQLSDVSAPKSRLPALGGGGYDTAASQSKSSDLEKRMERWKRSSSINENKRRTMCYFTHMHMLFTSLLVHFPANSLLNQINSLLKSHDFKLNLKKQKILLKFNVFNGSSNLVKGQSCVQILSIN